MLYHYQKKQEVLESLSSNPQTGLSTQQVEKLTEQYGPNRLKEKKKKSNLQRFFDQFKDVMIIILLIAAAISFGIACVEGDPMEFFEPVLILLIVVLNAIMGMMQESKAEKALDALKNMSAPHARVLRNGKTEVIDASLLVPGDIIHLEAGDFVPADARLLDSSNLKSEESALTGESVPSEKDADAVVEEKAPLATAATWSSPAAPSPTVLPMPLSPLPAWTPKWARLPVCWKVQKMVRPLCRKSWQNWART